MKCIRRFFIVTMLCAVAMANYEYPAETKGLSVENGVLRNVAKAPQSVLCPGKLESGTLITIPIRMPAGAKVTLATGRGQEHLELAHTMAGEIAWKHISANGADAQSRPLPRDPVQHPQPYWWENTDYAPNGRYTQTFSTAQFLLDWNAHFQALFHRNVAETFFPVCIELENGRIRWYLDHILLQEQAVTEDIYERRLKISFTQNVELAEFSKVRLSTVPERFHLLDISSRFNARGNAMSRQPGRFSIEGVPFEVARPNAQGLNCVDVGQSWFREGNSTGYEEPQAGAFGGRWGGALSHNHTRIQFRVPNRPFNALYLLASCEKSAERTNELTVQFYRPGSGFPVNFVPAEKIESDGQLHVIRIPVSTALLRTFADREVIELELTGKVHLFRAYPDPNYYSWHGAGTPSGVTVYAATLGTVPLEVDFQPEVFGGLWTEQQPAFLVKLKNNEEGQCTAKMSLETESYDGLERHSFTAEATVRGMGEYSRRFDLPVSKYGWHRVTLTVNGDRYGSAMVILRKRRLAAKAFDAPGISFGIWPPGNNALGHYGVSVQTSIEMAGALGIDSYAHQAWKMDNDIFAGQVRKFGLKNYWTVRMGVREKDVDRPDVEKVMNENRLGPSSVNEPTFQYLFAEPGGIGNLGALPEFYGEPPVARTPAQERKYQYYKRIILQYGKAFRKLFPDQKLLMPWGNGLFTVAFLEDPETREYIDGFGLDIGFFDRLPEMQFHAGGIHTMLYQFQKKWWQYKRTPPLIVTVEGPCVGGVKAGALTADQHAAHLVRIPLLLSAYGIRHIFSIIQAGGEGSSYWGEQHYSGGGRQRITLIPYPTPAAQGTMIRHLQPVEFVRWIPTGSLSTYCLEYRNAKTGKPMHVLWTIRGKRPVKMKFSEAFDSMDNQIQELVLGQLPIYVYGSDGRLELGEPDHSDVKLADTAVRLGEMSELFATQSDVAEDEYLLSSPAAIRRFPGKMSMEKGSAGLKLTLLAQERSRGVMPYYTTLTPARPIAIPGKAKYLTMEVTAASDWGRVVYVLKDAKGETWTSVGTRKSYNCDDTPNASFFNFDGKRLVRFELPSHLDWDNFREMGTTWWGSCGGDGVVDLPLTIERIHVERRNQAMHVNELVSVPDPSVCLGALYAEYESPKDLHYQKGPQKPMPPTAAVHFNPIAELERGATLPASEIIRVDEPNHYYDGTRGVFHFRTMANASAYDIWLSRKQDGTDAIRLAKNLTKSGVLVSGFLADTDFYAFVIYRDKQGAHAHPSPAFHLKLQDKFENK
ncbi:MAG: hypothetical protein IJJ33_00100 [Victivallales bacterium]|nr:hypothetical protein [Victivallales bacterium]